MFYYYLSPRGTERTIILSLLLCRCAHTSWFQTERAVSSSVAWRRLSFWPVDARLLHPWGQTSILMIISAAFNTSQGHSNGNKTPVWDVVGCTKVYKNVWDLWNLKPPAIHCWLESQGCWCWSLQAGRHTSYIYTFAFRGHLELPVSLMCTFFGTVGGNWSSWRNPAEARGQNMQTGTALSLELDPQPFCNAPDHQTLG